MSITVTLETEIPETRQVTLTLPSEFPVGRTKMTVSVGQPEIDLSVPSDNGLTRRAFPPRPTHPKLAREYGAFQQLLPSLLTSHRGQFVAVHDGHVVASGLDGAQVLQDAYSQVGYRAIYLAFVTDQPQLIARSGLRSERASESRQ